MSVQKIKYLLPTLIWKHLCKGKQTLAPCAAALVVQDTTLVSENSNLPLVVPDYIVCSVFCLVHTYTDGQYSLPWTTEKDCSMTKFD